MDKALAAPPAAVLDFNEKNFRPSVVETELYDWWERSGFFTPPAEPKAGEKTFVISGPTIGLFSSFSRSLTANAAAVAPSSASTTSSEAMRRTARQSSGVLAHFPK